MMVHDSTAKLRQSKSKGREETKVHLKQQVDKQLQRGCPSVKATSRMIVLGIVGVKNKAKVMASRGSEQELAG